MIIFYTREGWDLQRMVTVWSYLFPTLGILADVIHKFTVRKNESYFYHNASCSMIELYTVSFSISLFLSIFIYISTKWMFV